MRLRHGKSKTPIHNLWCDMRKRCMNPKQVHFHRYGGRGISVCKRWEVFENFYKDMGDPPIGMKLDRIDNNGNYTPSNCRWATQMEQQNNRSTNRLIAYRGETKTISQWARETGVKAGTIHWRLKSNILVKDLFSKERLKLRIDQTKRKGVRILEYKGVRETMSYWGRKTGIGVATLWMRLERGWPIERALTQNVQ